MITFLSDYGLADPFVGMCHAVMARLAPSVRVIDLTHGVPRQDVTAGAVLLADCVPYLPPGVTLAVVDPGVGTPRRAVAASTGEHWLVGPDNGLLALAVERLGGAERAWALAEPPGLGATFHGRDLFAPAAARLALGADPSRLGAAVDPSGLQSLPLPAPRVRGGELRATVLTVDGFGNLSLAAGGGEIEAAGFRPADRLTVQAAGSAVPAVLSRTFADVAEGDLLVLLDSSGRVTLAVNCGSAAQRLGVTGGVDVVLTPAVPQSGSTP